MQRREKPPQQVIQALGLQLGMEQAVEGLGFGLTHLIIRVIQRQDDAELQLLAGPAEVFVLVGIGKDQDRIEDSIVFAQRAHDARRWHIQLGKTAAAVLDQLEEIVAGGRSEARMRAAAPGVMSHSALICLAS